MSYMAVNYLFNYRSGIGDISQLLVSVGWFGGGVMNRHGKRESELHTLFWYTSFLMRRWLSRSQLSSS